MTGRQQYWNMVRLYGKNRPELTVREVRGDPDFGRLYGRYAKLHGQYERKYRDRSEEGQREWKRYAKELREILEEFGVEDEAETRNVYWY